MKDKENTTLEVSLTMGGEDCTGTYVTMDEDKLLAQIKMDAVTGDIQIAATALPKAETASLRLEPLAASMALKRANGSFRV